MLIQKQQQQQIVIKIDSVWPSFEENNSFVKST